MIHVHAADQELHICYLDVQRAFLHSPEEERVFTNPPVGFEDGDKRLSLAPLPKALLLVCAGHTALTPSRRSTAAKVKSC